MPKKNLNLLVIGGTGFIGRYVVAEAIKREYHISVICLNTPHKDLRINNVEYLVVDTTNKSSLQNTLFNREFDFIINLGGYINHSQFMEGGRKVIDDHYFSLLNILESINRKNLKRFIQIGSSSEYGDSPSPQKEDQADRPFSPYSLAKSMATRTLKMLYETEDFPAVIVRIFLAYGPGQGDDRFIPQIIKGCMSNSEFDTSQGLNFCDFTYIEDISIGIMDLLECNSATGKTVNLASGEPVQIKSIVEKIHNLIGKGKPVFGSLENNINNNNLYADISLAQSLISWKLNVSIEEGLIKTIKAFKDLSHKEI